MCDFGEESHGINNIGKDCMVKSATLSIQTRHFRDSPAASKRSRYIPLSLLASRMPHHNPVKCRSGLQISGSMLYQRQHACIYKYVSAPDL
jgi:hypothetical protein